MLTSLWLHIYHIETKTKWSAFCSRHFQMNFRSSKSSYFDSNFTETCSQGFIKQQDNIDSDNGLAPVPYDHMLTSLWLHIYYIETKTKWSAFCSRHFQMNFRSSKSSYFDSNFTETCSQGFIKQQDNIDSDNGLAPNRRQAIIWINDGISNWRIYALPSLLFKVRQP